MINCNEFYKAYWAHYISLEKEFTQTCNYVTLHENNYNTFSAAYLKLLLEIGSEIDVVAKFYCNILDPSFSGQKITAYSGCISGNNAAFLEQEVFICAENIILKPWDNKDATGTQQTPEWWKVYNKCKHERTGTGTINTETSEYLHFANMKYTLNALAALYQMLVFSYKELATIEKAKIPTPIPGSRLFELIGTEWEDTTFYRDVAFYIDDGHLIFQTGIITY